MSSSLATSLVSLLPPSRWNILLLPLSIGAQGLLLIMFMNSLQYYPVDIHRSALSGRELIRPLDLVSIPLCVFVLSFSVTPGMAIPMY